MGDDRPSGYTEGGITVYRASSIGKCMTALVATRLDYKPHQADFQKDVLNRAAGEGNLHEDHIVETLKSEYGWRVWGTQDVMEHMVIPKVMIRGHIDGLCRPKGLSNDRLLEIKTMSDARFKKWKAAGETVRAKLLSEEFEAYAWQISAYMMAYNLPAMYVVKNRNSGELFIEELKLAPFTPKMIRKKIIAVEKHVKLDELPPCEASGGTQFFCEFPYLHNGGIWGDEPDDEPPPVDSATDALIDGMAKHYEDIRAQIRPLNPLNKERKEVGQRIVAALDNAGTDEYRTSSGWRVKKTPYNRDALDVEGLAKELGMSLEEYQAIVSKHTKEKTLSYYPKITAPKGND